MIKIGVIREGKNPPDMRVPLTPKQCVEVQKTWPDLELSVQKSSVRAFQDARYSDLGVLLKDEVADADVLIGVKEVPMDMLVEDKTYFFFSHTTKEQPYNRALLQTLLKKRIRMIDYEGLTDEKGIRIIGFGYFAGVVGAYNGIKAWGKRHKSFDLCSALELHSLAEMGKELEKAKLPNIKIALTGAGRVASGVNDVMDLMGIKKVSPEVYLTETFDEPVYTQLFVNHYNKRKDGKEMPRADFYTNFRDYDSNFMPFAKVTDVYISGHFYAEESPFIFTREDAKSPDFKIQVVADISCDIDGPVASTLRPSTIAHPMYGYHAASESEVAFDQMDAITVMAVDNLPCEFPTVASEGFGSDMVHKILPQLLNGDAGDILKRATICENGKLTEKYSYLQDFVDGK